MRVLSLFSGIGGLDLGLERAGMTVVAQVEREAFARAVLAKHWPEAAIIDDVRRLVAYLRPCRRMPKALHARRRSLFGMGIECVCGGFPCQDVSVAGKGLGVEKGERSGLWREMRRVIAALRPRWVIAENVPALRTRGADLVLGDLERLGYTTTPLVVGAEHVGAPHRRHRVFIVGYAVSQGAGAVGGQDCRSGRESAHASQPTTVRQAHGPHGAGRTIATGCDCEELADAEHDGRGAWCEQGRDGEAHGRRESARGVQLADAACGGLGTDGRARSDGGHADECGEGEHAERPGREERDAPALASGTRFGGRAGDAVADADPIARATQLLPGRPACQTPEPARRSWWPAGPGQPQHEWEAPRLVELPLGGVVDGVPARLVRFANRNALKAYGNAVVPQVAEVVGRAVMEAHAKSGGVG